MTRRSEPLVMVKLQTGGREYEVVSDSITSIAYDDDERRADKLTLMVNNFDLKAFDDPAWKKGNRLIVSWGYAGRMTLAREAIITSVKGFTMLTVEASAESVLMNTTTKCRTFENVRRSDVVRQIAEENGYAADATIIDDTEEIHEVISQYGITDAQFINRLSRREGFEFYVDHQGFHWHARRMGQRPTRKIVYYLDGSGEVIGEPSIENDITKKPGRVRVRGRDPITGEELEAVADNDSDSERGTLSESVEIIDGDAYSTEAIAASTTISVRGSGSLFGSAAAASRDANIGQEETVASSQQTQAAITAEARARYRRAQHVAIKMTLPIIGDPDMYAKTVFEFVCNSTRLSQLYYIKSAKHVIDQNGYVTTLKVISDGHGGHSTDSQHARGLSLVQAGSARRGGRGGPSSRQEALDALRQLEHAATSSGDAQAVALATRARQDFEARGFEAGNSIRGAARAIGRIGQESENGSELIRSASVLTNVIAQGEAAETATGGQRNRQTAPGESDDPPALVPFEEIDGDGYDSAPRFTFNTISANTEDDT